MKNAPRMESFMKARYGLAMVCVIAVLGGCETPGPRGAEINGSTSPQALSARGILAVGRDCDIVVRPRHNADTYERKEIVEIDYTILTDRGTEYLELGFYGHKVEGEPTRISISAETPVGDGNETRKITSNGMSLVGTRQVKRRQFRLRLSGFSADASVQTINSSLFRRGVRANSDTPVNYADDEPWTDVRLKAVADVSASKLPKVSMNMDRMQIEVEYLSQKVVLDLKVGDGRGH